MVIKTKQKGLSSIWYRARAQVGRSVPRFLMSAETQQAETVVVVVDGAPPSRPPPRVDHLYACCALLFFGGVVAVLFFYELIATKTGHRD